MKAANTVAMAGDLITRALVETGIPVKVTPAMRRGDRVRGVALQAAPSRRAFLGVLALAGLPGPSIARAQGRALRVGVLGVTPSDPSLVEAFAEGLRRIGYDDGRNVVVDHRHTGGQPDRLADLARDLARSPVDVLFARGAGALAAARQATSVIPIVAVDLESDPVAMGFVKSLARPGGNVTGVFLDLPDLSGKQLQLMREVIPTLSRVAVLGDPVLNAPQFAATDVAARALAMELQRVDVRATTDIEGALDTVRRSRASAVLLLSSPLVFANRAGISALAMAKRLAAVSMFVEFAEAGGLMAYGPSLREAFRRGGVYVGRVLQGARAGELPVERPEKFDLVVNVKTARALRLTVPRIVTARADKIID
jgi:putative ABC transport system substrate-binding protein